MRTELFCLLSFGGFAAMSLLCGILVWPQLVAAWPSIEESIDRFRRLPPLAKLVLLLFIGAFVVYGSTKTNQVDQASGTNIVIGASSLGGRISVKCAGEEVVGGVSGDAFHGNASTEVTPTVTPEDIARGWQLWEVRTNSNVCYTMPEGATMASNWWVRGAYEDVVRVSGSEFQVPSFRFPYGSNEYCSAWAFTWGKVRFALANTNTEIVAIGAPMSAVPYRSRLWSAADTNDSRLVTWENFVLGRASVADYQLPSTNYQLVSAQIELRSTGDFITRSNEVETVYRRVDPDDWDDDGWRNDDDPDPYVWEEFWDDFYQELPEGDFACNYCWVEIRPQWNSWIVFEGDGPSNLDDPCFWAKAGETYRVQLLIGKTYDVMSTQPLSVVGRSNEAIQVSESGSCSFSVVWPVTFTVGEGRYAARPLLGATLNDGGRSFYVLRDPPFLRGTNVWWDGCRSISGDGTNFTFACDNTCTCEGCTTYGYFTYSGYTLDLPGWFECGCHYVPDEGPAEVSISFDRSAVIYEDAYTNQPGEVVHPARSNAVLRCSVSGGTYGGTFSVTLSDAAHQKLSMVRGDILPTNVRIDPGTSRSYEVVYSVLEPSGRVGDISAEAVLHEDFLNETQTGSASMTAVKVELEAKYPAFANPDKHRHLYGVAETVYCHSFPSSSDGSWSVQINGVPAYRPQGSDSAFCASWTNGVGSVEYSLGNVSYRTGIRVLEPYVEVRNPRVNETNFVFAIGESGHLLLCLDQYVAPYYVSFRETYMMEIPDESDDCPHTGYYTNRLTGAWSHSSNQGAGNWCTVDESGYWGVDRAGTPDAYPEPWAEGVKSWDIPVGWGFGGNDVVGRVSDPTKQIFTIHEDGRFRIEKYNHWAERNIYGLIWLDGALVLWPW